MQFIPLSLILSCNDVNNKIHRDTYNTYTHIHALCNKLCRQLIKQSIPYNISLNFTSISESMAKIG